MQVEVGLSEKYKNAILKHQKCRYGKIWQERIWLKERKYRNCKTGQRGEKATKSNGNEENSVNRTPVTQTGSLAIFLKVKCWSVEDKEGKRGPPRKEFLQDIRKNVEWKLYQNEANG